ncbi:MAG: hypothetical protein ABIG98_05490, partial [Chloroflexota bacterium]
MDGYLPGVRDAFSNPRSLQARAFLHSQLDPFAVVRAGEEAKGLILSRYRVPEEIRREKRRRNPAKGSGRTLRKKTQGMAS